VPNAESRPRNLTSCFLIPGPWSLFPCLCVLVSVASHGFAADIDEFKVKREAIFEFARNPVVTRQGDQVEIRFETKGFCDVTVAIEEGGVGDRGSGVGDSKQHSASSPQPEPRTPTTSPHSPKIVRHLASGVLGPKAPPPLQPNSKSQVLTWDGKDDQGHYVDDREALRVRVSLGLQARFERTLFWSPEKRGSTNVRAAPVPQATAEGVYVLDGGTGIDHLRLFSHAGEYQRTVYPFPAYQVGKVEGLFWHPYPHDGRRLPIKPNFLQSTLLTSGTNAASICYAEGRFKSVEASTNAHFGQYGRASEDLAVAAGRIALASLRLNRLATDGTTGGLGLYGPRVDLRNAKGFYRATDSYLSMTLGGYSLLTNLRPHRLALSPDGKTLYLTRYTETYDLDSTVHTFWQHGVYRMDVAGEAEPELFLGAPEPGTDDRHFDMPADVATDARGRVYVADHHNDRVQIFTPGGRLLRSIRVESPAQLAVSPKTGELCVFSWRVVGPKQYFQELRTRLRVLTRFKSADDPQLLGRCDLPMPETKTNEDHYAEVDFWTDPPTLWLTPSAGTGKAAPGPEAPPQLALFAFNDGKLERVKDFEAAARQAVVRTQPPVHHRQRLYWDPKQALLFVGEGDGGEGKSFRDALTIDPETGRVDVVRLPFDCEDLCFGIDGLAYLRTAREVVRYDPATWREVPWDYGVEREKVTYNVHSGRREARAASALPLPTNMGWHQGGMHVSPKGHLVVGCLYWYQPKTDRPITAGTPTAFEALRAYQPRIYPGRLTNAAYGCEYIHVWDERGRPLYEDAIPGLGAASGVAIDRDDSLYVLSAAPRVVDGTPYFDDMAGTLMKFPTPSAGKARILNESDRAPVPLPSNEKPQRPPDLYLLPGEGWVEGAAWLMGGVGWGGKNRGNGCACWNCRFALDHFARSFAPEMNRYSVAVLDSAGNVILRIGQYGNVDDGVPLVPHSELRTAHSIGGDEAALFYAPYVATHTDRRLFIADPGNGRILSVRLDYYTTETVSLRNVRDGR
jgi:hypothetical protein